MFQGLAREEDRARGVGRSLEGGGGKLVELGLGDDFVHSAAAFFANADATHEGGEGLIAGAGRAVEKTIDLDERQAGVGDLHAIGEDFNHRSGAGNGKILVNEGVGDEFANGRLGVDGNLPTDRLPDDLGAGGAGR